MTQTILPAKRSFTTNIPEDEPTSIRNTYERYVADQMPISEALCDVLSFCNSCIDIDAAYCAGEISPLSAQESILVRLGAANLILKAVMNGVGRYKINGTSM